MKTNIGIVALVIISIGLSGCDATENEAPKNRDVYTSLEDCVADWGDTERQCAVLRTRYIETVRGYNASIRSFPSNVVAGMHGLTSKDQLQFDDEAQNKKSPRLFKQ